MVVFICGSCNDSLKKSVVATHLARCKPASISCCDCSKEFSDESYVKHNQCISEDAKYGPESQRSLNTKDKGAKKQEEWTNAIKETLKEKTMSGRAEMVFNKLLENANIPRIKNKFVNFLSNCSVKVPPDIIEEVWSICDAATKKMKATNAHQHTPDVKAKPVAQVTETPKDNKKKKKKLKQTEGEEVESGETSLLESSEGPDQGESQAEGGDQTNGSSVITKQSKKKKQLSKESESKEEGKEKENEKAVKEMTESNGEDKSAETNEVDNDVKNDEENSEPKSDDLKKKSKRKKKRNHSETEENQEKFSDSKEEEELKEDSNDNECDPKKKKMADEKEKETTTTSDSPMDQDVDKMNGNEEEPESQPINWFKQLKRQIKEKETVEMKDFKKMIKRLKKSHNLTVDVTQLTAQARVKLMKRHNYCVADGQIKYTRLF